MFETKDYGLNLEDTGEAMRLPDATQDIGGNQIDAQEKKTTVIKDTRFALGSLRSSIKNSKLGTETGIYGPNGTWGMEPLTYDPVGLDLSKYT